MPYFTKDFVTFFRQLARNNRREWYHAHKADYVRHVKEPFEAFVAEMIHRMGAHEPAILHLEPRDAIYRVARDTRFSKDKTPYKTFVSASIAAGGRKHPNRAGLFFWFGAKGAGIAGGMYEVEKEALIAIRRTLVKDGATFARLLRAKAFRELFGELRGERNKRLPPEFAEAVERHPFIAHKQFYYYAEYPDPKIVLRDDLPAFLMKHYRAGRKVNEYLRRAVG